MTGSRLLIAAAWVGLGAGCPRSIAPTVPELVPQTADLAPDSLVILVVIDQMPVELIERLGPAWTGGLRRALDQGVVFTRAEHAHARTYTAPGHASLATGVYPARHGVVTNDWLDVDAGEVGEWVSPVEDPEIVPIPATGAGSGSDGVGRRGAPRLLMASTVGDWLHAASPRSQVVAVAGKDRSAILMGGTTADAVTWFDTDAPGWITSSYYGDHAPAWLVAHAESTDIDAAAATGWSLRDPADSYLASTPDAAPGESFGGTFPHGPDAFGSAPRFFKSTWHGDASTVALGIAAIEGESLGQDEHSDLLMIGLSGSDYVGHAFGPHSREVEDHYRRLDRTLERLWDHLDRAVERGRIASWSAVLTADHGVAPLPEHSAGHGHPDARRVDFDAIAAAHPPDAVPGCGQTRVFVDRGFRLRFDPTLDPEARDACVLAYAAELEREPSIARAYSHAELEGRTPVEDDPDLPLFRRGHFAGRSPEITVRLRPRDVRAGSSGTRHGSPHPYDRAVPLIVLGTRIRARDPVHRPVFAVDVAPTLARLVGIEPPPDLDGTAIPEITRH